MRTRIHIARNRLHNGQPPIVIETGSSTVTFASQVEIEGPSSVVHMHAGMPAPSGGRRPAVQVWIETGHPVIADGERVRA